MIKQIESKHRDTYSKRDIKCVIILISCQQRHCGRHDYAKFSTNFAFTFILTQLDASVYC